MPDRVWVDTFVILLAFNQAASRGERQMTPDERNEMNELCQQIQIEKDPKVFEFLVQALLELLENKHQRIDPGDPPFTIK